MNAPRILAAAVRSQHLVITVLSKGEILEVRRHVLPSGARTCPALLRHIREAAEDFDATMLVVEPGTPCCSAATDSGLDTLRLRMIEVKNLFLPSGTPRTHEALFEEILKAHPRVSRLVRLVPGTFRVSLTERKKTVSLLSLALGFAAHRTDESRPSVAMA